MPNKPKKRVRSNYIGCTLEEEQYLKGKDAGYNQCCDDYEAWLPSYIKRMVLEARIEELEGIGAKQMSDKLKPCPFCGGEAEIKNFDGYHRYANGVVDFIQCKKCGGRTREYYTHIKTEIDMRQEAIKAWNRRTNDKENG